MEWELREVSDVFPSWVLLTSNIFAGGLCILFTRVSCLTKSSLARLKQKEACVSRPM